MSNFHMLFLDDADRSFFVDGHFRSGDGLGPEVLRLAESAKRDFKVELRLRVKEVGVSVGTMRAVRSTPMRRSIFPPDVMRGRSRRWVH